MATTRAETEARVVDRNTQLVDQLQEEVTRLASGLLETRQVVDSLYRVIGELRVNLTESQIGNKILTAQLVEVGQSPAWSPTPPKVESDGT